MNRTVEGLPPGWAVTRERYSVYRRTTYGRDRYTGRATTREHWAHPWLWTLAEPDGYERVFGTRPEAVAFARMYEGLDRHDATASLACAASAAF